MSRKSVRIRTRQNRNELEFLRIKDKMDNFKVGDLVNIYSNFSRSDPCDNLCFCCENISTCLNRSVTPPRAVGIVLWINKDNNNIRVFIKLISVSANFKERYTKRITSWNKFDVKQEGFFYDLNKDWDAFSVYRYIENRIRVVRRYYNISTSKVIFTSTEDSFDTTNRKFSECSQSLKENFSHVESFTVYCEDSCSSHEFTQVLIEPHNNQKCVGGFCNGSSESSFNTAYYRALKNSIMKKLGEL